MKKIVTTVMALTLALGMSVTALADTNPSQSQGEEPIASIVVPVEGVTLTVEEQAIVDAWDDNWDVEKATITNADAASLEATALAGTTGKEAVIMSYGDVVLYENEAMKTLVNDGKVKLALSFKLESVKAADNGKYVAYVKVGDKWLPMETIVEEDGAFVVVFSHFSPMALVKVQDKAAAPTTTTYNGWAGVDKAALWAAQTQAGATSPKTGEAGVVGFALIAVACGAALVFTKKKFA